MPQHSSCSHPPGLLAGRSQWHAADSSVHATTLLAVTHVEGGLVCHRCGWSGVDRSCIAAIVLNYVTKLTQRGTLKSRTNEERGPGVRPYDR